MREIRLNSEQPASGTVAHLLDAREREYGLSVEAMVWAYGQKVGNPTRKLILIAIADGANDRGLALQVPLRYLAEFAEIGERAVRGHLQELETSGLARRVSEYGGSGAQRASNIELLMPIRERLVVDREARRGLVYALVDETADRVKIGFTSKDLAERVGQIEHQLGYGVESRVMLAGVTLTEERDLHQRFAPYRLTGEWFALVPEVRAWLAEAPEPEFRGGGSQVPGGAEPEFRATRGDERPPTTTTTSRGPSARKLPAWPLSVDIPDDMAADAQAFLDQKRKVGGKVVTPEEMLRAAAAMAEFNRQADADQGLASSLEPIVGRLRDRPSWDVEKVVRLVQSAFVVKWWERAPRNGNRRLTPAPIFGNAQCFEMVVQDAADLAAGKAAEVEQRRGRFDRAGAVTRDA